MAYFFEFDSTYRIHLCRFEGRTTEEELATFYGLAADCVSRMDPGATVTDFPAIASLGNATVETIRALAPETPQADRPRIIVATPDEIFAMARLFERRPNARICT